MTGKIDSNLVSGSLAQVLVAEKSAGTQAYLPRAASKVPIARALVPVDYRLVIEKSAKTGSYVYKTLNSFTGEVVSQQPAEGLSKLASSDQYSPGLIVNAKA